MRKHSFRNLNFSLSMLQITARRLQKVKGFDGDLVSELFGVVDIVSTDTDDVSTGLEEILSHCLGWDLEDRVRSSSSLLPCGSTNGAYR